MARWARVIVAAAVVCGGTVAWGAGTAGADVVRPEGSCRGAGEWLGSGQQEDSVEHERSDVIEVPAKDTVRWSGALGDNQLGDEVPRRDIDGSVELQLPAPFGWVTIDDWDGSSVRAANEGEHSYNLPKVLVGIEMTLRGHHNENGVLFCEGRVKVKVEGSALSNPLAIGGIAGMVVFGGLLLYAGRPVFTKVAPAYEDVNPG